MALIWWRSDTFAHGVVVYPISLWLIWRKRAVLEKLAVAPANGVLILLGGASFGWLLGELGGVQAASHLCLVVLIALSVWAVLGTQFTRHIAFPLAFTLLAVPMGDFLVPILMEHTADFTVGALRFTGIPVYREGNNFVVPSGSWSVVEACSGLRYLIASMTLGLLYAYLSYTSVQKRVLFVIASALVPIVANWARAYMIVMVGHLSGMKYAVGVDHLLYGWVFFGIVMLLLFWVGSFWREDLSADQTAVLESTDPPSSIGARYLVAAVSVALLVTIAPVYLKILDTPDAITVIDIAAPRVENGWIESTHEAPHFLPHFVGARANLHKMYERDGRQVGLYIGYYAHQREGAEVISSQNSLLRKKDRTWIQLGQRVTSIATEIADVVHTRLRSRDHDLEVWHSYWTGERWSADPKYVKLQLAANKLLRRGDDAAVVVIYARVKEERSTAPDVALSGFVRDMGPSLAAALAQTRERSVIGLAHPTALTR